MKLSSQESSLKEIVNDPKIYGGKATLFQTPNKNQRGSQAGLLKFSILLRGGSFTEVFDDTWHRGSYVGIRKGIIIANLISQHKGGVTKPFEKPSTYNNDRV